MVGAVCVYAHANTPTPTHSLEVYNDGNNLLLLLNDGPGWLLASGFVVVVDSFEQEGSEKNSTHELIVGTVDGVSDTAILGTVRGMLDVQTAFKRVAEELLQEDAGFVARTMHKLVINDPGWDTAPVGIPPGGNFCIIKLGEGKTLDPSELLLLEMVLNRWTVSFKYKSGFMVPHRYTERVAPDASLCDDERDLLCREHDLEAKLAANNLAPHRVQLQRAEVSLARCKLKRARADRWAKEAKEADPWWRWRGFLRSEAVRTSAALVIELQNEEAAARKALQKLQHERNTDPNRPRVACRTMQ